MCVVRFIFCNNVNSVLMLPLLDTVYRCIDTFFVNKYTSIYSILRCITLTLYRIKLPVCIRIYRIILDIFYLAIAVTCLRIILYRSGDVEKNPPGPTNDYQDQNTNSFHTSSNVEKLSSKHLSFMHPNIQSLLPKIDLINSELSQYDVLIFKETWLNYIKI